MRRGEKSAASVARPGLTFRAWTAASRLVPAPLRPLGKRLYLRERGLRRLTPRAVAAASRAELPAALTPVLVDYYARDGSTALMRLLATSPQVAVEPAYPYETKYLSYLWSWSRLIDREDWPEEAWGTEAFGSIALDNPLVGAPPWRQRALLAGGPGEPSMGERCFELAWREFSRRAAVVTRIEHGAPDADVRYYAEKHLNSWELASAELPEHRLLVTLRDPRDVFVSILAFTDHREVEMGRGAGKPDRQYLDEFIHRQGLRLRWIAKLLEQDRVPVVRYAELVHDLPGVARRVGEWLGVSLQPEPVAKDRRLRRIHATAADPAASLGRWRQELAPDIAERITTELAPELAATGIDPS